jgi:hypothetical protein
MVTVCTDLTGELRKVPCKTEQGHFQGQQRLLGLGVNEFILTSKNHSRSGHHQELEMTALEEDRSPYEIVEEAVLELLSRHKKKAKY